MGGEKRCRYVKYSCASLHGECVYVCVCWGGVRWGEVVKGGVGGSLDEDG